MAIKHTHHASTSSSFKQGLKTAALALLITAGSFSLSLAQDAEDKANPETPDALDPVEKNEATELADKIDRSVGMLRSSSQTLRDAATKELSALDAKALPLLEERHKKAEIAGEQDIADRLQKAIDAIREREGLNDQPESTPEDNAGPADPFDQPKRNERWNDSPFNDEDLSDPNADLERMRKLLQDILRERLQDQQDQRDQLDPSDPESDESESEESDQPRDPMAEMLEAMLPMMPDEESKQQLEQAMEAMKAARKLMEEMRRGQGGNDSDLLERLRKVQPRRDGDRDAEGPFGERLRKRAERVEPKSSPRKKSDDDYGQDQLPSGEDEY